MKTASDILNLFRLKSLSRNEEALADYIEGRLSGREKERLDRIATKSSGCRDDYAVFDCVVRASQAGPIEDAPPDITRAAVDRVLQANKANKPFVKDTADFAASTGEAVKKIAKTAISWLMPPEYAMVRGATKVISPDLVRIRADFSQLSADIEIEKREAQNAVIRVSITGDEKKAGLRVTLKKQEREVASQLANGGYVVFEGISFDHYSLDFTMDGRLLGQYPFELKESGNG